MNIGSRRAGTGISRSFRLPSSAFILGLARRPLRLWLGLRVGVRVGFRFGLCVGQRGHPDRGTDLVLDFLCELGIFLQEVARVVLALADAVLAIVVPGAGLLD